MDELLAIVINYYSITTQFLNKETKNSLITSFFLKQVYCNTLLQFK